MNKDEKKAHEEAVKKAKEANNEQNASRLAKIEAIADANDETRTEDEELIIKDAVEESEQVKNEAEAKQLQEEGVTEEVKEPQVESDTKEVNGETYYRMMVNGTERWQTMKQIRDAAQKVESADEYLRQAAESVRNASRLALSHKDEPSKVEEVDLAEILRAAVLGDDDAIKKMASYLQTRPSELTPDVVRTIDQRLSFRTELASLEDKSKDLLQDPYMGRLFRARLNELKAENAEMGLSEAYTSIDKELREAFPARSKTQVQDKLERKRTLVNVPTAASRQVAETEPEGEEDVGSVIEKMAKARGLTPHVHSRRQ